MIDSQKIQEFLNSRYEGFEIVSPGVIRVVEEHAERTFAVRFFDLNEKWAQISENINEYQEQILAPSYFKEGLAHDLRWNHYLYFIADDDIPEDVFNTAKKNLEKDKSYARKTLLRENELKRLLDKNFTRPSNGKIDPTNEWTRKLGEHGLSYVIDDSVKASSIVELIIKGEEQSIKRPTSPIKLHLSEAEKCAAKTHLNSIKISGFRDHFCTRDYNFGQVNLIFGPNGAGKTSLLEAIEFLYCGANFRDPYRGNNGRSPNYLPETSVKGLFGNTMLETFASWDKTKNESLQSRNLNWYAKVDSRKSTLCDVFAIFNFLNTDAAVRLSNTDEHATEVKKDIDRLLLGAEVQQIATVIRKINNEIDKALRERRKLLPELNLSIDEATARLEVLRDSPKLSDIIFDSLKLSLEQLGWKYIPSNKDSIIGLEEQLKDLINAEKQAAHFTLGSRKVTVKDRIELSNSLSEDLAKVESAEISISVCNKELEKIHPEFNHLNRKLHSLSEIKRYVDFDFSGKANALANLQNVVDLLRIRLSELSESDTTTITNFIDESLTLEQAARLILSQIKELGNQLSVAKHNYENFIKSMESAAVLRAQLISAGQQLLSLNVVPKDECPLCLSPIDSTEIIGNSDLILSKNNDSRTLNSLSNTLAELQSKLNQATKHSEVIKNLTNFSEILPITIKDVLLEVENQNLNLERYLALLDASEKDFEKLEELGLNFSELNLLLKICDLESVPNKNEWEVFRIEIQAELDRNLKYRDELNQKISNDQFTLNDAIKRYGFEKSPSKVSDFIRNLNDITIRQINAIELLDRSLNREWNEDKPLDLLLEQASNDLRSLNTAIASEKTDDEQTYILEKSIESRKKSLDLVKLEIDRLMKANVLIEEILEQDDSSEFSNKILSENAATISEIFSAIHSPKEFEVNLNQKNQLVLVKRNSDIPVSLNEMSTGQRAAYALALFFAMNMRLNSTLPIILLDDPIAHIDDLNILSFLDYLREIAIRQNKQIFFATADEKLAGLFKQKFNFLGDSIFRTIVMPPR